MVRIKADHQQQTIAAIQDLYEKYNPGFPFTFNFLSEAYQKQYDTETRVAALIKIFCWACYHYFMFGVCLAWLLLRHKKEEKKSV